jgi:phosphate transport system ATP-binding protein
MLLGEVVEHAPTEDIFFRPKDKRTEAYVEGRYG